MFNKILKFFFGDYNEKEIKRIKKIVHEINKLEESISHLSKEDFLNKTNDFKKRLSNGESLDNILPEAFALVREASKRTLNQRHRDVQLIGGIVLHEGKIAELKTGEGKTLMATAPLYLNSLTGNGAYLITVNDYLANRDSQWMGKIYNYLGVTCGCITHDKNLLQRKQAYNCDITYGTNNEFGFDYLRDNMAVNIDQVVQRQIMNFAVVDEVDSILIDEARTPLIISSPAEESTEKYVQYAKIANTLIKDEDYIVDEKIKNVILNENGIKKVEKILNVENIYTVSGFIELHHLEQALKAKEVFKRDIDYVIQNNEIIIVDEFTGRLMPGRRYSDGLHQAIEAKENVYIQKESKTMATISFQNYFRMFNKLAGMTGTAKTEAEEFMRIYKLDVICVPTHLPVKRIDYNDKIYKNTKSKFAAIVNEIKEKYSIGQPVLVGTTSIEKSEILSTLLKKENIPHNVLNAKYHAKEAEIIAQAGRKYAVTIATNMAGRGTDILLGGNPEMIAKQNYENSNVNNKSWYELTLEEQKTWIDEAKKITEKEKEEVLLLGGLHVIGTERHESRRIDNQLRGRAGRQGDPGSSQFYVAMDDPLMRHFGSERIMHLMDKMNFPEDLPIQNKIISSSIESAQKRVEGRNFDIRKHLVEYDDVMNKHREIIYKRRKKILYNEIDFISDINDKITQYVNNLINNYILNRRVLDWEIDKLIIEISNIYNFNKDFLSKELIENKFNSHTQISTYLIELLQSAFNQKINETLNIIGNDNIIILNDIFKSIYLKTIDILFVEHIDNMQQLRENVAFVGMAQKDPLVVYKNEAYNKFINLINKIDFTILITIFKSDLTQSIQLQNLIINGKTNEDDIENNLNTGNNLNKQDKHTIKISIDKDRVIRKLNDGNGTITSTKINRNAICPCGSGKKYKKCCGK